MVNRVLLNQTGLKVSKPGVNVLTASEQDLFFSSDRSMMNPLIKGQFSSPNVSDNTINYGKTFAQRPMVFFMVETAFGAPIIYLNDAVHTGDIGLGQIGLVWRVTCNDSSFYFDHPAGEVNGQNPLVVRYIVWDYNL